MNMYKWRGRCTAANGNSAKSSIWKNTKRCWLYFSYKIKKKTWRVKSFKVFYNSTTIILSPICHWMSNNKFTRHAAKGPVWDLNPGQLQRGQGHITWDVCSTNWTNSCPKFARFLLKNLECFLARIRLKNAEAKSESGSKKWMAEPFLAWPPPC